MKIEDIEIVNTLNEIQKINDMIALHQGFGENGSIALDNYQLMREDLLEQLRQLLHTYNLTFSWSINSLAA